VAFVGIGGLAAASDADVDDGLGRNLE